MNPAAHVAGVEEVAIRQGDLHLVPCSLKAAFEYVAAHHAHHKPPQGGLFAVGIASDGVVRGVAVAGRPVARNDADGRSFEIAARALGYTRGITFTLPEESGASLRAAGWLYIRTTPGGSWSRDGRPRIDKAPIGPKLRWEIKAGAQ